MKKIDSYSFLSRSKMIVIDVESLIAINSNKRMPFYLMITAHCFADGVSNNFGQVSRSRGKSGLTGLQVS